METNYIWNYICRLTNDEGDGHRIFTLKNTDIYENEPGVTPFEGGVVAALADNSGALPHLTDDGVLWLDPSTPLMLTYFGRGSSIEVRVPVIYDGRGCSVFVAPAGALELLALFPSWKVMAHGKLNTLVELCALHIGPAHILGRLAALGHPAAKTGVAS